MSTGTSEEAHMFETPHFDYYGDLQTGDRVDLDEPPHHCGEEMNVHRDSSGAVLVCFNGDYEITTDKDGALVEPPYITR